MVFIRNLYRPLLQPLSNSGGKFLMALFVSSSRTVLCTLAVLVGLYGCSSDEVIDSSSQAVSSTDEQIFVGDSIEMSYDPNVIMKRAESFFEKESYAEAIVEYKHFMDLHRNHVLAPYAQYKIGVSHYKQFQTVDRDPMPLEQSIKAFKKLVKDYPGSRYEAEANMTTQTCREQLAQRHLMVGEFYYRRESYLAAAHRFEKVIKEFPEMEVAGDAMFQLAKTYENLDLQEWSHDWLYALLNKYPDNQYYAKAQAKLEKENPTLLASLPKNSPSVVTTKVIPLESPQEPGQPTEPSIAHAGKLPSSAASLPDPNITCKLGDWCESNTIQSPYPHSQDPEGPKTCKAGEWC